MRRKPPITVVKDAANPEPIELLAKSIVEVSKAFEWLNNGPLTRRAIVLLLHDRIGAQHINKSQIELVLDNLPRLRAWYVKEPKK